MSAIWKYAMTLVDREDARFDMPDGARILSVNVQDNRPIFWALVDPEAPKVSRRFRLVATGEPFDGEGTYHGTVLLFAGQLVFHLFELPR